MNEQIAFYEGLIREDPTNIDARLRLAAMWKAQGKPQRAVEQYAQAGRQLAAEGLLMEAIAACKAIIELDPHHTETLLFMASLYARKPSASSAARVVEVIERKEPESLDELIVLEPSLAVEELSEDDLMVVMDADELRQTNELDPLKRDAAGSNAVPYPERVLRRALNISLPEEEPEGEEFELAQVGVPPISEPDILISDEIEEEVADGEDVRASRANTLELSVDEVLSAEEAELLKGGDATWGLDDTVIRPFTEAEIEAVFSAIDEADFFLPGSTDPSAKTQEAPSVPRPKPAPSAAAQPERSKPLPPPSPSEPPRVKLTDDLGEVLGRSRDAGVTSEPRYLAPRLPEPPTPRAKQTFQRMAPPVGLSMNDRTEVTRVERPQPGRPPRDMDVLDRFGGPERPEVLRTQVISPAAISISRADLPQTPLFSRLSPATFVELLKRINLRRVPSGETILSDRDHNNRALFLIVNGSVDVLRQNDDGTRTYLAELGRGEFFGEFQLLTGRSRQALVRAANTVDLLELEEEVIAELAEETPEIWKVLWDFYHARLLNNLLAGSPLFRSLSVRERNRLVPLFERVDALQGQLVIRQGELGVGVYLVLQGEMVVMVQEEDGGTRIVTTLSSGDFFGTVSAMTDDPCVADVRANEESILLFLKRDDLAKIFQVNPKVDEAFTAQVANRDVLVGQTGYGRYGIIKFTG